MIQNTPSSYGSLAKFFHWAVAILILALLGLGKYMHDLPQGSAAEIADKFWFFSLHKTLGILVFLLALMRILWALRQIKPSPLASGKPIEHVIAEIVHFILYLMLILMPLSGWLHHAFAPPLAPIWFNPFAGVNLFSPDKALSGYFSSLHFYAAIMLALAVGLHVLGAIKHTIIDKDTTLRRMLPLATVDPAPLTKHHSTINPLFVALFFVAGLAFTPMIEGMIFAPNSEVVNVASKNKAPSGEAFQANWAVISQESQLAIEIDQGGTPTKGEFKTWQAVIKFDPDQLETSKVNVEIQTGSLDLGDLTEQAISDDFLSAENFPTAHFKAEKFERLSENQFIAHGELSLSGINKAFELPFELTIKDDIAVMNADIGLNRIDHGVGAKGFSDESSVGFNVNIRINLKAKRI